ncbi:opioid growth factor receptor-related protein [Brevundimonas lutea]|uniref:opioid growth factor receptor-related protein n=1 Tax=Brevundimonas lutea TaxID=2293980 RepID=UPI0013CF31D6|nr:opioid growth factor receptor-related protein [Brevundimonas lutea]
MSAVADFLEGVGVDAAGRDLETVLASDDGALERSHDFIQWLFPLDAPSRAVATAPVLAGEDVARIRRSTAARTALARSSRRMLGFYERTGGWRAPHDHNHLRISRIIRSLRLLLGDAEADAFRTRIETLCEGDPISAGTRRHWSRA